MLNVADLSTEQRNALRTRILDDLPILEAVEFETDVTPPQIGTLRLYPDVDHEVGHVEGALPEYLCGCHSDGFGNLYCILVSLPE